MTASASGRIWDDAFSTAAGQVVQRFEEAWEASTASSRPDPRRYLPEDPELASGALLALLRAEMGLRHAGGEEASLDFYMKRFPELGSDSMVALVYEDFCLREEEGEGPDPASYYERYPELASRLRPVLDIHELVGSARTVSFPGGVGGAAAPPYPEVGQTIGGFYLAAELGRGSFARVFRAEERQLADRPVALKVARAGSREPQTLARLQHTHIVPVHSYRVDRVSGLHLLCMPYLGSVTLEKLLASQGLNRGRSGAELLVTLDALESTSTLEPNPLAASRQELARRTYHQAIAWWGARLAEALQHAHDRGVLHRDIKPSNVLVTSDGLPMLLDFNLAWEEACLEEGQSDPGMLGGTLAYMAPEQIEGLATGKVTGLDARSDVYSLGVVLYEAIGGRPFEQPAGRDSVASLLRRMAEQRRAGAPRLGQRKAEVSPALEAVVHRCLAGDPAARYRSAAELSADLQAVADDAPLRHAKEPLASRSVRWIRRNRGRAALAAILLIAPAMVLLSVADARFKREHLVGEIVGEMRQLLREGNRLLESDQIELAQSQFLTAYDLGGRHEDAKAGGWLADPRLQFWQDEARDKLHLTREKSKIRAKADQLFSNYEQLCLHLMEFVGKGADLTGAVESALAPFYVLPDADWPARAELTLLDAARRDRLFDTVDDLLFLWVLELDGRETRAAAERAVGLCRKGESLSRSPRPWEALRERCEARAAGLEPKPLVASDPATAESSGRTCFRWGLLFAREKQQQAAITWLDRASRLDPMQFWYHYYLGFLYERMGEQEALALTHYNMAVALRPHSPFVRFSRSKLFQDMGHWTRALEDLDVALEHAKPAEAVPMRLNRGTLNHTLGRFAAAREEYEGVLAATGVESLYHRAARWNLARIEAELGRPREALEMMDELLESGMDDSSVRLSRAVILLQLGEGEAAEAELDRLIASGESKPDYFDLRARARYAQGRFEEAEADAIRACELDPSPAQVRLRIRVQLACGDVTDLPLEDPEEWRRLPMGGASLRSDLKRAAALLENVDGSHRLARLNRAIILSMLEDYEGAIRQADEVLADDPESIKALWVRSWLREAAGDLTGALEDLERGVELEPGDPQLLERQGSLLVRAGRAKEGLSRLELALHQGAGATAHRSRAEALMELGQPDDAIEAWTVALQSDSQDARAYLGRARAAVRSGLWGDYALADLEKAAAWAGDQPELLLEVTREYARFMTERGERLPRVLSLVGRSFGLYLRALTDRAVEREGNERVGERPNLILMPPG